MPLVKHILTFSAGEWSPLMDGRADLEKYGSACRRLENAVAHPQGAASRRPGMKYIGRTWTAATDAVLVEFGRRGDTSLVLVIAGGKMKVLDGDTVVQDGGSDYLLAVPWDDGTLHLLRWKQINDVMFFVHPNYPPKVLERFSNTNWDLSDFVPRRDYPMMPENVDRRHRITASFKTKADFTTWATATAYEAGDRVKKGTSYYVCENDHTSNAGNAPDASPIPTYYDPDHEENRLLWAREFADAISRKNQKITLTSNKATWTAANVGGVIELHDKRGAWEYESRLPVNKTAKGATTVYSKVLQVQGRWTFQTFGNWSGNFAVQVSRDLGKTWITLRIFKSTASTPRNATAEGEEERMALLRIAFNAYSANGTSGSPYALLSVEGAFIRGVARITEYVSAKEVKAVTIEPVAIGTTSFWAEGAWSARRGYPRAIEFHQNRVILAATNAMPHTVWGSAVDDYDNFRAGTDADEPFAHTLLIGQREPISWLVSDRNLLIGSAVGVFVLRGESEDAPITPESGFAYRHASIGSHLTGPGAIQTDTTTLFVQHGGRVVRELGYRYESDRYQAGNLSLLAGHLPEAAISDFALMRTPFQVLWFVAGGKLYSLTYEPEQQTAGWQRHTTSGTVHTVACVRRATQDDLYLVVNRSGTFCIEKLANGIASPANDGYWSDSAMAIASPYSLTGNHLAGQTCVGFEVNTGRVIGPATLNAAFFTGAVGTVIVGLPYTMKLQPMTPEAGLQNGSSRSREARIHAVALNLLSSLGGKLGEDPDGTKFDPLRLGDALFTGEKEIPFEGRHGVAGNFAIVHADPHPFILRSLALKLNFYGDAR